MGNKMFEELNRNRIQNNDSINKMNFFKKRKPQKGENIINFNTFTG